MKLVSSWLNDMSLTSIIYLSVACVLRVSCCRKLSLVNVQWVVVFDFSTGYWCCELRSAICEASGGS